MRRRSSAGPIPHNIRNTGFNLPKREAAGLGVPQEVRTILKEIYGGCVDGRCPCGLKFDPKEGLVPRGVGGAEGGCNAVELVVVGINPGRPKDDESECSEKKRYAEAWSAPPDRKIDRLVDETTCWTHSSYAGEKGEGEGQYHKRLNERLRKILGVNNGENILGRVYFTELVKCSTDGAGVFSPEFRSATRTCATKWLAREIHLFPNIKAVVALGMDTYKAFCLWDGETKVFYLAHPSRPCNQSKLDKALDEVKQALGR